MINNKITLYNYEDIYTALAVSSDDTLTIIESCSVNYKMYNIVQNSRYPFKVIDNDEIAYIKAVKNETELKGYKNANEKDGVALVKFFPWLENKTLNKKTPLNEYQIGLYNKKVREDQDLYMGESFYPICGSGPNSAIVHYKQRENQYSEMTSDKIILCGTGAQYLNGTTDITRTVHNGTLREKKKCILGFFLVIYLFNA